MRCGDVTVASFFGYEYPYLGSAGRGIPLMYKWLPSLPFRLIAGEDANALGRWLAANEDAAARGLQEFVRWVAPRALKDSKQQGEKARENYSYDEPESTGDRLDQLAELRDRIWMCGPRLAKHQRQAERTNCFLLFMFPYCLWMRYSEICRWFKTNSVADASGQGV